MVAKQPGAWHGFADGPWQTGTDVADFVRRNRTPYEGDATFLSGPTFRTRSLWRKVSALFPVERRRGIYDVDTSTPAGITAFPAGYIDAEDELIVGLQTDAPLKRAIMPNGGLRMVDAGLKVYGYDVDPLVKKILPKHLLTHDAAVSDTVTARMRAARAAGIVTGLPDAYGRGRVIGDYRRVALYGVDRLIAAKRKDRARLEDLPSSDDVIRDREELAEQVRALEELAHSYGFDVSEPAAIAREAVQWVYFGYLAAAKEQNGTPMPLGRASTFLDVYLQRDIERGLLDEKAAQELVDDLVIKLRLVRFLRTPEYDALFSGDPAWVTESIGGMSADRRPLVTRTSFRFLQTLYNLGPAPEPNLTVLWSPLLPEGFKRFCARVSLDTSAIQYASDELLRSSSDDDTAVACCVTATRVGKDVQLAGGRVNLAKALLYAINGGRDEISGKQVAPAATALTGDVLEYDDVLPAYERTLDWLAELYVDTLDDIHSKRDRHTYEALAMALHDHPGHRSMSLGIVGLSTAADSLSAIKQAQVKVLRDETGLAVDYAVEGEFPRFGHDDDRADRIAEWLVESFMERLRRHRTYRDAVHSLTLLTVPSNVVYGKHTGATPDGRKAGEAFGPGAHPVDGRDGGSVIASATSMAKLPYDAARDGISLTATTTRSALSERRAERIENLVRLLDGYTDAGGFHVKVNVLDRTRLEDAVEHPERFPDLTVRLGGYAVSFTQLTPEQQRDVISRTFGAGT